MSHHYKNHFEHSPIEGDEAKYKGPQKSGSHYFNKAEEDQNSDNSIDIPGGNQGPGSINSKVSLTGSNLI